MTDNTELYLMIRRLEERVKDIEAFTMLENRHLASMLAAKGRKPELDEYINIVGTADRGRQ